MTSSTIRALIPCRLERVWSAATAVDRYPAWRSDLSRTEVLSGTQFVEYTKSGFPTTFTTTVWEPCRRWEFDLENRSMTGHWTGLFTRRGEATEIVFTEHVRVKRLFLRPLAGLYLKQQQSRFVADLRAALTR